MAIFTGAGVAIVTPMKDNGEVNFDELGRLIDFQIENNTDCIVICGTTGESATLSMEEHAATIKYAVEKTNHRVPVVAGTGSNCTETAILLSKEAEEYGADGCLVVTPYYNKATQNGLIAHYTAIAKNVVAIKEASGNIGQVANLAALVQKEGIDFSIYSGNDDQIVPLLSLGGKGVISVLSNIAPQQTHDIVATYLAGDVKKSAELQLKAMDLIHALFCEVNPIPVKAALNMMGFCAGSLRSPLSEMEDNHKEILKKAMIEYGLEVK